MIFIKLYNIESRRAIGPENKLCAGACMDISAQKFYMLGSEGVKLTFPSSD